MTRSVSGNRSRWPTPGTSATLNCHGVSDMLDVRLETPRWGRSSLVLERLERVELRSAPRREDRGDDPDEDRGDDEDDDLEPRHEEVDLVDARDQERREDESEHDPDRRADERDDDALVADHPPHLAARHADRAQRAELSSPLEDGQHERVDDPEDAHEHREREEHVEHVEDALQ